MPPFTMRKVWTTSSRGSIVVPEVDQPLPARLLTL